MKNAILAAFAMLVLGACGTFEPVAGNTLPPELLDKSENGHAPSASPFSFNPKACNGMTCTRVVIPTEDETKVIVAEMIDGKDRADSALSYTTADGRTITYGASLSEGVDAQKSSNELEAALAKELKETWTELAPEIKTGLLDAACVAFLKKPCGG